MADTGPRRARSLAEFGEVSARLFSPERIAAGVASWRPRPTDVVITPYGKCGTTWLQQAFHTLRTGGDMDFDDISRVVPWIETAAILDLDLEAPQRAEPRGFKSHLDFHRLPKGAKAVVSFRDPKDALVSMHRFMEGWFIEPGAVTIAEFAQSWLNRPDEFGYFGHLVSWWEQKDNPSVLLLSYERMSADRERAIRRLAAFCGIALDDALLNLTLEHTSMEFMLRHKDRFDDSMMRRASEAVCGLPAGSDSAKVRRGVVGSHRDELPREVAEAVDRRWREVVTPKLGFPDYMALEAALGA